MLLVFIYPNIRQNYIKAFFKEKEYSDIIDLVNKDEEKDNLSKKIIGLISEKKKELPRQVKVLFLKLSDDTDEIDTICFSEVLENLNFELMEGKIVSAKLVLQKMKDSRKYVVVSLSDIEKSTTKKKV